MLAWGPWGHISTGPHPCMTPIATADRSTTEVQVARWQAGDETAFALLYARLAPMILMRVVRHRVWPLIESRFQAEDVVQEAWMRVVPKVGDTFTPSGTGSFLAYVSKVTDNTLIDLSRRAYATKRGDGAPIQSILPETEQFAKQRAGLPSAESPTSAARYSELRDLAIRRLNERELLAWELVEIKGYIAEEAGLAMDCTGSAVRSLVRRARAKLVLALGDHQRA